MSKIGHNNPPATSKPIKCFQKYSVEQRTDRAASHRLGHNQRNTVGEVFWINPDVPGIAFPTRKAALEAENQFNPN